MIEAGRDQPFTYEPVGATSLNAAPPGYRLDRWSIDLGQSLSDGGNVFARAADTIREWNVQRGAGLIVLAEGPPAPGVIVAIAAPLPIGYIDVVCRVVDIVNTDDRYGFAYGTLPVHPERGEESFTVVRDADGNVKFEIVAVWRSKHPLARAFPFIARMLQRKATNRYLDAMRAAAK